MNEKNQKLTESIVRVNWKIQVTTEAEAIQDDDTSLEEGPFAALTC
jgi:hypothetical protein